MIKNCNEFFCRKLRSECGKPAQVTHKYSYVLSLPSPFLTLGGHKGIVGDVGRSVSYKRGINLEQLSKIRDNNQIHRLILHKVRHLNVNITHLAFIIPIINDGFMCIDLT